MKKEQENIEEIILLKVIENTADENERKLFKTWLEISPENAEIFEQLKKTWELASVDQYSLEKNWESIVQKVKASYKVPDYIELPETQIRSVNFRMNTLFRAAAMLILLLGVSFLLKIFVFAPEQLIISGNDLSPNEPWQLADGSLVYLNGNSEISFSKKFGNKNRMVKLKGEAFFEVERNEKIPFSITTYNTTVKVLGTSFNVYSDQSELVRVSVVSGVVEFSVRKKKNIVQLRAGEQGIYDLDMADVKKENIFDKNLLAWKTGILDFDETPLMEVLSLLQKQYLQVLVFEEKQDSLPTLTTSFNNQSLETVLEELNLLLNVNYETRNDTIFFKPNS